MATTSTSSTLPPRPPLPPFIQETAHKKVKAAQDAWNTMDPATIVPAYTDDCIWRNRDSFLQGRDGMTAFLTQKWAREKNYRLRKELFAFTENKIAVQFWYEYQLADTLATTGQWYRCYGLEDWTFAADGRMRKRMMSGNDVAISEEERWFRDGVDANTVAISEKHW